jgi:hypothetical protein
MDTNAVTSGTEDAGRPSTAQIIVFATVAAATAAAVGIATYLYILKSSAKNPQQLLHRCREAIEQIERGLDVAHA